MIVSNKNVQFLLNCTCGNLTVIEINDTPILLIVLIIIVLMMYVLDKFIKYNKR